MSTINFLLGAFALAICFNACFSQNLTSNAKTCSDCNSTNADCNPKQGYVMCSCKSGFIGNGLNCTRVVFCDTASCCSPGYTWDSSKKLCVDVDECQSSSLYTCLTKAECINKNGIYLCNAVKNPVCPSDPCSFDQDCVRNGADLSCVDPCTNYQEIDGSRRLYTLNSVGRFPTDRYLFGWYRYANGLSLKEGYVGSLKCGSVEPYTLSSHPSVSEGVKSVPLLTNGLTANSTGPSIMVKACPGGYYVYKLAGLMKFEVYCTDFAPTTTTTTTTTTTSTTTTTPRTTTTTTTPPTTTPTTTTTRPTTTPPTSTTTPTTSPTTTSASTTIPTTTPTTPPSTTTTTTSTTPTTTTATTTTPTTPTTPPSTTTSATTTVSSTTPTTTSPTTTTTTPTPTVSTTGTVTTPPTTTTTKGTTSLTTHSSTPTTPCENTTFPLPTLPTPYHPIEENITVTNVQSRSVLTVQILTQLINNQEAKILEINETTTVNIEVKTISPSKIYIKTTKSVSPTSILIYIGSDGPQTSRNTTDPVITTTESTAANTDAFNSDSYCSKPAQTSTSTETSTIAGNTCSKVTSASTTTTITTTEEVIVVGPNGFAKSCTFH